MIAPPQGYRAPTHRLDRRERTLDANRIARPQLVLELDRQPGEQAGEGRLHRQTENGGQQGRGRQQGGDVDAERVVEHQRRREQAETEVDDQLDQRGRPDSPTALDDQSDDRNAEYAHHHHRRQHERRGAGDGERQRRDHVGLADGHRIGEPGEDRRGEDQEFAGDWHRRALRVRSGPEAG